MIKKECFISPSPKKLRIRKGTFLIAKELSILLAEKSSKKETLAAKYLISYLKKFNVKAKIYKKKELCKGKTIILSTLDRLEETKLTEDIYKKLLPSYKGDQGYYLSSFSRNRVYLVGTGEQGVLYGMMSLIQLFRADKNNCLIPQIQIIDWPDFEYRCASNWLIHGETTRWGYDWGDGVESFVKRTKKKLEFCLKYKINMVHFEGFNWDCKKFPGYAGKMRELNRYARERGISLVFGGYGIGLGGRGKKTGLVGIDFVRGLGDKNRISYPEGKVYQCCGDFRNEETRFNGTCRSNEELNKLKRTTLAKYVKMIEPGALYIHHEDLARYEKVQKWWDWRCNRCREKWPNNKLEAVDGAAGAVAEGYNWLCEAVYSVKNKKSGYDGEKDCRIILISPLYTHDAEPDVVWNKEIEFWKNVSRQMKHSGNVYFGFREQFLRKDTGKKRITELSKAMESVGKEHKIYLFAVGGADLYTNDLLFVSTPALNYLFEKADIVFNFSGHLHQEPLQVLNSEYQWNVNSPWYTEKLSTYEKVRKKWTEHTSKKFMPEEIYGEKGFLEKICLKIYGKEAGKYMAQIYRLGKTQYDGPLSIMDYPEPYTKLPVSYVSLKEMDSHSLFVTYWSEKLSSTTKALKLAGLALASNEFNEEQREDVEWFFKCLTVGEKFAGIFLTVYSAAGEKSRQKKETEIKDIKKKINQLKKYLKNNFSFNITSPGNSDIEVWTDCLRSLSGLFHKLCYVFYA